MLRGRSSIVRIQLYKHDISKNKAANEWQPAFLQEQWQFESNRIANWYLKVTRLPLHHFLNPESHTLPFNFVTILLSPYHYLHIINSVSPHQPLSYPLFSSTSLKINSMHSTIPLLRWHPTLHNNRLRNLHIPHPSILHLLTIHARRRLSIIDARPYLIPPLDVHVLEVKGVDVAGEVTEEREQDVDEEVDAAAGDEEDADGWD